MPATSDAAGTIPATTHPAGDVEISARASSREAMPRSACVGATT
jgi:hypothetical protein